eukprot:TRINITY_DN6944_c1_g1_i1.p1 TRINITY_DN6944_c1_g1~~TRINITY_DN6944_c1_g1_i1.p1  ORF type:complete len:100 (+),score=3.90 TRINITY_DN6944_c1_g1_i1:243-542(+)
MLVTTKCNSSGELSSFEYSNWSISGRDLFLRILVIYRPPYSEKPSFLESTIICKEPLIITGDFNIHMPSESCHFSNFFSLCFSCSMSASQPMSKVILSI